MNKWYRWVVVSVFAVGVATRASAQDRPPMEPPPAPHKVEQYKKMRLIEEMHLDEETSIRFFVRYNKQMDEIREIQKQRNETVKRLKEIVQRNPSSEEIESEIKNYEKLEGQIAEVRVKFLTGLKDIFTPKQIAEYLVFEQKFNQNLREVLRDMTREHIDHMQ
ncbi:MAG TPA: hypothetical protein VMU30_06010 [Bacteroidota bacterium]|nr:hypothetical protein [Bacteroidota bacterium]